MAHMGKHDMHDMVLFRKSGYREKVLCNYQTICIL